MKTAYEDLVAHASKIGELYADLAKELCKPIEEAISRKPVADDQHLGMFVAHR